uniref:Uncharacterized protein n=1 Tax=Pipistrellus kuhlii TaxID=59472 RepID=A0A7J7ZJA6_PIPKU|nr:hypothetical protein mPipKuh1_009562 [Pipistrellus kuhlii]
MCHGHGRRAGVRRGSRAGPHCPLRPRHRQDRLLHYCNSINCNFSRTHTHQPFPGDPERSAVPCRPRGELQGLMRVAGVGEAKGCLPRQKPGRVVIAGGEKPEHESPRQGKGGASEKKASRCRPAPRGSPTLGVFLRDSSAQPLSGRNDPSRWI